MDNTGINYTDIAVIAVVLLSALLAFARGLVREVLSVFGWVGAAVVTLRAFPHLQPFFAGFIKSAMLANTVAAAVIFLVTLVVLTVLSNRLASGVRNSGLSAVDRSLGFVFGILRGAVLVCLGYLIVSWIWPAGEQPVWLKTARTMPVIQSGASVLRELVPEGARDEAVGKIDTATATAREQISRSTSEEIVRRLAAPAAVPRDAAGTGRESGKPDPGYSERSRSDLNRLLETTN